MADDRPLGCDLAGRDCDEADGKYFLCIKAALIAHMQGHAPIIAVEFARKLLYSLERPSFEELENSVDEAPTVA